MPHMGLVNIVTMAYIHHGKSVETCPATPQVPGAAGGIRGVSSDTSVWYVSEWDEAQGEWSGSGGFPPYSSGEVGSRACRHVHTSRAGLLGVGEGGGEAQARGGAPPDSSGGLLLRDIASKWSCNILTIRFQLYCDVNEHSVFIDRQHRKRHREVTSQRVNALSPHLHPPISRWKGKQRPSQVTNLHCQVSLN